jgi:hypothetical protein
LKPAQKSPRKSIPVIFRGVARPVAAPALGFNWQVFNWQVFNRQVFNRQVKE